ncbi:MAG: polymorphic toxin-type HINT domain-containing protein, partial [Pirellula sp.]
MSLRNASRTGNAAGARVRAPWLSWWFHFRSHNPFLGDYVDYEGTSYFLGDMAANFVPAPTSIAKKGTMVWKLYNQYDDAGRCASIATKLIQGGCFVAGTPVTVSSLPGIAPRIDSHWSDPSWLDEPSQELPWLAPERFATVATRTEQLVPIESLPIGARVPTKNPNRWEVDPQPEPEQATWAKLSITVERSDGGIVDAELIRPRSWILANGICAGRLLPLNLPELDVSGLAMVTSIDDCPPIADGEGSVVTARFVTREVHIVASVDVLGSDGAVETITGTTIHPVWSVERREWVPLGELVEGETLQGQDGLAVVLSVTLSRVTQPVYNIEVHGEHVYQVGELGVLVHNAYANTFFKSYPNLRGKVWVHHRVEQQVLTKYPGLFSRADIDDVSNLVGIPNAVNSKVHLSIIRKAWNR